jgi:hypothetical protein
MCPTYGVRSRGPDRAPTLIFRGGKADTKSHNRDLRPEAVTIQ